MAGTDYGTVFDCPVGKLRVFPGVSGDAEFDFDVGFSPRDVFVVHFSTTLPWDGM